MDAHEQRIYQKIDALKKQIDQPVTTPSSNTYRNEKSSSRSDEQFSSDVDRLESMMQLMNDKQENDPEMQQLSGTLDKILDIQHPERVKERIRKQSLQKKTQVFTIGNQKQEAEETFLKHRSVVKTKQRNSFYEESTGELQSDETYAIAAVIHETKTITTGSTVKLRLATDVYINGVLVPKGSFVFGNASVENERLQIAIPGIRYQNNLLPVALEVYDLDGLPGIYIPGSIGRDVAKQSAGQSLQSLELMSMDPSLKAQAVAAGVSAAKNLLNKKVALVTVTVKAGYQVLLKDNNKRNE